MEANLNSWDYVDIIKGRIEEDNYPVLMGLEDAWQMLEPYYEVIDRDDSKRTASTPLGVFLYMVDMGFYPPPEILITVADCFQNYLDHNGCIELEEAFFPPTGKRVRNYAHQKAKGSLYLHFHMTAAMEKRKEEVQKISPKKNLEAIADEFLGKFGIQDAIDVDTFLRNYRRWRKKEQEKDQALKADK